MSEEKETEEYHPKARMRIAELRAELDRRFERTVSLEMELRDVKKELAESKKNEWRMKTMAEATTELHQVRLDLEEKSGFLKHTVESLNHARGERDEARKSLSQALRSSLDAALGSELEVMTDDRDGWRDSSKRYEGWRDEWQKKLENAEERITAAKDVVGENIRLASELQELSIRAGKLEAQLKRTAANKLMHVEDELAAKDEELAAKDARILELSPDLPIVTLEVTGDVFRAEGEGWSIYAEADGYEGCSARGRVIFQGLKVADIRAYAVSDSELASEVQDVCAALLWSAIRANAMHPAGILDGEYPLPATTFGQEVRDDLEEKKPDPIPPGALIGQPPHGAMVGDMPDVEAPQVIATIGERHRVARIYADISLAMASSRLNLLTDELRKIEKDWVDVDEEALCIRCADVYGVSSEWLRTGLGDMIESKEVDHATD